MSSRRQFLVIGSALGLIAGLLLGAGAVLAQGPAAAKGSPAQGSSSTEETAPVALAPTTGAATGTVTSGPAAGTGVARAGMAIAYPYFGGTPGLAPDNTIVVTGVGQAELLGDGSGRAAAQETALAAAISDARSQADAIARATGLAITGVLSVSASVSPYGPMPYAVAAPESAPNTGAPGQPVPAPDMPAAVWPQALSISVTVAYRVD